MWTSGKQHRNERVCQVAVNVMEEVRLGKQGGSWWESRPEGGREEPCRGIREGIAGGGETVWLWPLAHRAWSDGGKEVRAATRPPA